MKFGLEPQKIGSITKHYLPHEPSEKHQSQVIILPTSNDVFKEFFTSTKGCYHEGPAEVVVNYYPSGISVLLYNLKKEV